MDKSYCIFLQNRGFMLSLQAMDEYRIRIIRRGEELPPMESGNFFHSPTLFYILCQTPRITPYMVVAEDERNKIIAHILVSVRRIHSWLPPFLYSNARIYGEGEYSEEANKQAVFGLMLSAISKLLHHKRCFYIEVSDLSQKMFGYKQLRENGYFPIHWQKIHNSLHSCDPKDRISQKMLQRIEYFHKIGIETTEATDYATIRKFYQILRAFYRFKFRRFIPSERLFEVLHQKGLCRIFITSNKNKIIGGTCCLYCNNDCYLWYLASRRKRYIHLHPHTISIWHAIQQAYADKMQHIRFMDVGLPYKKNLFRNFILQFGGKPVGTFRWFHFNGKILNIFFEWIYKES